jgi:hypothetical protein
MNYNNPYSGMSHQIPGDEGNLLLDLKAPRKEATRHQVLIICFMRFKNET